MSKNFKEWIKELIEQAPEYCWGNTNPVEACGEECWKEYFDSGHSPSEALFTDSSYN